MYVSREFIRELYYDEIISNDVIAIGPAWRFVGSLSETRQRRINVANGIGRSLLHLMYYHHKHSTVENQEIFSVYFWLAVFWRFVSLRTRRF